MRLMVGLVGLVLVVAPASATTVGKSIDAELYEVNGPSGTFIHVLTQFTSPALIGPGSEFSGVLQFGSVCSSCISGIEIDFDDTGFTVFSTIGSISHNGSQFGIKIFNLPDNIIDVLEFPCSLILAGVSYANALVCLTDSSARARVTFFSPKK